MSWREQLIRSIPANPEDPADDPDMFQATTKFVKNSPTLGTPTGVIQYAVIDEKDGTM
jgi:hypothetical protein